MEIHFLGTRGYVEAKSHRHRHHSAFVVSQGGFRLLCDFGESHRGRLSRISPDAIFISHAHPDHAGGLAGGTSLPVYASAETIEILRGWPVRRWKRLRPGRPARVGPWRLWALPVAHSIRCPCVAMRLEGRGRTLVYSADLVAFEDEAAALGGGPAYVGDGSTLTRPLVRRHSSGALIGHTTIRAQLSWLARRGVKHAIFSHLGTELIEMGDREAGRRIRALAAQRAPGVEVEIAHDGARLRL
jgi:ribonuclease BN (tRNA processing enzyme)